MSETVGDLTEFLNDPDKYFQEREASSDKANMNPEKLIAVLKKEIENQQK